MKLEFWDGVNWYSVASESYLDNKTISIAGAVNGSGPLSSPINTSLSATQNMNGLSLKFNWSNSGSFAEYYVANNLQDSSPPPQFVYDVLVGGSGTLRGWQLIFQPGFSSQLLTNFQIDYIHPVSGRLTPFRINTYGSSLRTYFGTTIDLQGNNLVINSANPVNAQDLTTKNYVDSKVFNINSSTSGQLNINRLSGYPANSSVFLRGDGAWASPGGSSGLSSNSINVNTDGGNTNWLRRNINTTTGTQVYGLTSSGYIIENNIGESAGIGFDGSTDTCTIWTAGDGGTFLNIQDEDTTNARAAYVATTGAWTVVSSEKRKHSIRSKRNNNVLERFLKLSVKTYGYKYPVEEGFTKKKEKRIEKKSNKMATGLILEEVFKIFPNCIPDYYNPLFQKKKKKELSLDKELKNIENSGIDYNTLMCYFIMAFQELAKKVEFLERKLEKAYNLQS